MSEEKPSGLEALAVRRTKIAGAEQVRYRVYSGPNDFVSVAADSALMAVRVSGIAAPYKIVRDLPGESGLVETQRLVASDTAPVPLAFAPKQELQQIFVEMAEKEEKDSLLFVPMGIKDLQGKGMSRARILPAEMLQQIIDEHAKQAEAAQTPVTLEPREPLPEIPPLPAQELTQEEKITQLANEVLPAASPETSAEASLAEGELSPEEVQKLLGEESNE